MRLAIIFLCLVVFAGCPNLRPRDETPQPDQSNPINRLELLRQHNQEREKVGVSPLKQNADLENFAQEHAEWMARRNSLRHSNIDVPGWDKIGENIAWGQEDEKTVVADWMSSSGHKKNILDDHFTHVGFGYAYSKTGKVYWCAVFGG